MCTECTTRAWPATSGTLGDFELLPPRHGQHWAQLRAAVARLAADWVEPAIVAAATTAHRRRQAPEGAWDALRSRRRQRKRGSAWRCRTGAHGPTDPV
eukprot:4708843-Pleurochrysis_carterae.AAC.1